MELKPTYVIDEARFSTLEGFYDEISRVLIPGAHWGHNLDAFNDILRGGFGTPEGGFLIRWENSGLSRERLGAAFDRLIDIVEVHSKGRREEVDGVELILA